MSRNDRRDRRNQHRHRQRRAPGFRLRTRDLKAIFAVSYVGAAITNLFGYWGPSWLHGVWFIPLAWMVLRRVHFHVRVPRLRHMNFDINLSRKSVAWMLVAVYLLLAVTYRASWWGSNSIWWLFLLPPFAVGLWFLTKHTQIVTGLLQRIGDVSRASALKGILMLGLPMGALWRYFSENALGMVDATALMLVWALVAYLWWPRNSLHGPQDLDTTWKRALWAIGRLAGLCLLLFAVWMATVEFIPGMITIMALELYALWAWSHPHPIHGLPPATGSVNLPIPRAMGIQIVPLILIEGSLVALMAAGQWYVGLPTFVWVMAIGLGIVIYVLYVNRWKSSNLVWMTVVLDMTNRQLVVNPGISGSPKLVTFDKLGGVSFVDTPAAEDLLHWLLGVKKFKVEVIGGGATEFLIVVRGATFPRDPDNAPLGTALKGKDAVIACFGWLSKQQRNGVRR